MWIFWGGSLNSKKEWHAHVRWCLNHISAKLMRFYIFKAPFLWQTEVDIFMPGWCLETYCVASWREKEIELQIHFFLHSMYTHAHLWFPPSFLAVNHHNTKNWITYILTHNLSLIFIEMKQKKKGKIQKKIKMAN